MAAPSKHAQGEHLLLAARKRSGELTLAFKERERAVNPLKLLPSPFLRALGERSKLEVFPDSHRGKKPAPFGDERHPTLDDPLGRLPAERLPFPSNHPGTWYEQGGNRLQQCRFAGAVRADEGDHLPRPD